MSRQIGVPHFSFGYKHNITCTSKAATFICFARQERREPVIDLDDYILETTGKSSSEALAGAMDRMANRIEASGRGAVSLKVLRLRRRMTQKELADRLGTSQAYVSRLETGRDRNPGAHRVAALANILGVSEGKILESIGG